MKKKEYIEKQANRYSLVVIGVSWGGVSALRNIFSHLSTDFSLPIIIVQHISKDFNVNEKSYWEKYCKIPAKEAEDKEKIKEGHIYFAPPNYHVIVERDMRLSLDASEPVNYARPSVDVLFESAALALSNKIVAIILTGANNDGADGLKAIKESGGLTIVQNPNSAECSDMPGAALDATDVDHVLELDEIGPFLMALNN